MAAKWMQKANARMKQAGTEGSFTRIAHRHGKSPMEMAHTVHAHPSNYSPKVRKKAQFALNANQ